MRSLVILGILLMVLGLFTYLVPGLSATSLGTDREAGYTARSQVIRTLDVPVWASAAAMVTGLVFVIVGASVRPRTH